MVCVRFRKIDAADPPSERSSHCISVIGNKVLLFGGEHIARTPIDSQMHTIDLAAEKPTWTTVDANGEPPSERIAHTQCVQGGFLWVFGGRQGIDMTEAPLNDLHRFNMTTSTWEEVKPTSSEAPCARSFHRMVSVGQYLYVFGGCAAVGRLNDLHRFDTKTAEWEQLPSSDAIAGRGGACFAADGDGNLYVIAGFAGKEMNDLHRFSVESGTWEQLPSDGLRPRSVCGTTTTNANKLICIFGGEVDPSGKGHEGAGAFADDVVIFDPASAKLSDSLALAKDSEPAPTQRGWAGIDAMGDAGFVLYGGLTGDDESPQRLGDLYVCELVSED